MTYFIDPPGETAGQLQEMTALQWGFGVLSCGHEEPGVKPLTLWFTTVLLTELHAALSYFQPLCEARLTVSWLHLNTLIWHQAGWKQFVQITEIRLMVCVSDMFVRIPRTRNYIFCPSSRSTCMKKIKKFSTVTKTFSWNSCVKMGSDWFTSD